MTPRILDVLKREGVTATFFLLVRNATEHPDLVDRIVHEGHEVGCHSDQHLNAWKVLPTSANRDIDQGYSRLERWIDRTAFSTAVRQDDSCDIFIPSSATSNYLVVDD